MINDGTMPVLYAAGSLVIYAHLVGRGTTPPGQGHIPFDSGEAAKDPFGVNVTPPELDRAIADAIQSRLDDHSDEWETLAKDQLIKGVLQYSEGETRQVQDVRKRYMLNLKRAHVTPARVMFVQAAQADLKAQGPNRDHAAHHAKRAPEQCARPQPLRTVSQARMRATMAVRAVLSATEAVASAESAAAAALAASTLDISSATVLPSQTPAPIQGGELEVETEEDHRKRDNELLNTPPPDYDKILFAPGDAYAFEGKAAQGGPAD